MAAIVSSVLPSVAPTRSSTSRLSRGASGEQFKKLAVSKELVVKAQLAITGRQRIAVWPSDDPDCIAVASMTNSALLYAKNFLVADPATVASVVTGIVNPSAISELERDKLAKQLSADWLVICRKKESGERIAELFQCKNHHCVLSETIEVSTDSVNKIQMACEKLSSSLKANFGENAKESMKLPTTSKAALVEVAQGYQRIFASVGFQDEAKRQMMAEDGLRLSQSALEKEPTFLQASLLQASCLDVLDKDEDLKNAFTTGFKIRNSEKTDRLTMLEFEGDYARYVLNDREQAAAKYTAMLDIDPNHLRAHWSLIETALDEPVGQVDEATLMYAAENAAAIIVAHPESPLSVILEK